MLVAAGVVVTVPTGAAGAVTLPAPTGLTVVRDAVTPTDLLVAWKPVAGVSHYMLRVNEGARDVNTIVDAAATSFVHHGSGSCTRYRVWLSAVGADGAASTTGVAYVPSLAPGGVSGLRGLRNEKAGRLRPSPGWLRASRASPRSPATAPW